jgi:hypothetical protein
MKNTILILPVIVLFSLNAYAFEVKAKALSFSLCAEGKCETEKNGDEVIYDVDLEKFIIIRKAVVNYSIKDSALGGGLQSDNTIYKIVHDQKTTFSQGGKPVTQRILKAVGQPGTIDGFETIVIGEDFIITSRSSSNYFVIYQYQRLK